MVDVRVCPRSSVGILDEAVGSDRRSVHGAFSTLKALVDDPAAFTQEMTRILLEKQSHPLIAQMIKPAGSSDPPPSNSAASSSGSHEHHSAGAPVQFQ